MYVVCTSYRFSYGRATRVTHLWQGSYYGYEEFVFHFIRTPEKLRLTVYENIGSISRAPHRPNQPSCQATCDPPLLGDPPPLLKDLSIATQRTGGKLYQISLSSLLRNWNCSMYLLTYTLLRSTSAHSRM